MAEVELGPAELDRLEDALEELEHEGALDRWLEDEPSPQVRARLADYRSLLAMSREALPIEDVPAGVLDDVLAQAREAAAVAPAAAAAAGGSWWSRMRRSFMVPALALAGTAALVLWVFDPADRATLTDPPAPAATAASAPPPPMEAGVEAEAAMEERRREASQTVAPADEADRAEPEPEPAQAAPAAQPVVPSDPAANEGTADAGEAAKDAKPSEPSAPGMGSLGEVPGYGAGGTKADAAKQQQAGGSAGPASGRWDLVSRGDRARQAGDCVGARDEYAVALEDDEPRVRARAFAGLGLCDAQAGDEASADANFERARELDGEIGSFIESQQQRSRSPKKRKSASKKSKPSALELDDVNDPFGQ